MRLQGDDAIRHADEAGLTLSVGAVGGAPARDGLSVDEARAINAEHPGAVYLEVEDNPGGDTRVKTAMIAVPDFDFDDEDEEDESAGHQTGEHGRPDFDA
jgi:hypothetical protein